MLRPPAGPARQLQHRAGCTEAFQVCLDLLDFVEPDSLLLDTDVVSSRSLPPGVVDGRPTPVVLNLLGEDPPVITHARGLLDAL